MKADRDEASPYAAMLAAQDVAVICKERGVTALHVKLRATGGTRCVSSALHSDTEGCEKGVLTCILSCLGKCIDKYPF